MNDYDFMLDPGDEFSALVISLGFSSAQEWQNLISSVDISTPEKEDAFRLWKLADGTKSGLLDIMK